MERIVRAYWDCQYCGTKEIDGLTDICPNCGKQKSENVKCYMKPGVVEYVSDEELKAAKINKDECDGNHKDWVCNYCNQLNNYTDENCVACGSSKTEATHEYGMERIETENETENEYCNNESHTNDSMDSDDYEFNSFGVCSASSSNKLTRTIDSKSILKLGGIAASIIAFLSLIIFLFYPLKHEVSVNGFSWNRSITVEEERTVKENGWSVPSGGRVYDEREEFKEYIQVIDHYETVNETKTRQVLSHYETVSETKTRQVISHYETTYTYRDNGNGTYTEVPHQEPVYTTETYVETHQEPVYVTETYIESHQEPVYRQEAVYDTKYYYEIDKWFDVETYNSSGTDHNAYWNTSYTLDENERDTDRSETYYVYYTDDSSCKMNYNEWLNTEIGDGFIVTQNRLGIVYSREAIEP